MPETDVEDPPVETPAVDDAALGDAGEKALKAERKARRDAEQKLKNVTDRLAELENAGKSELEKAQVAAQTAQAEAVKASARADRLEVAMARGLSVKQASRLVGDTKEELEADASELLETFKPAETSATDDPTEKDDDGPVSLSRRPVDSPKGGLDPDDPAEPTVEQMLAAIPMS